MSDATTEPKWLINWDNGASACGTFPFEFDSYEDADAYGKDWADECNARDGIGPDDEGYSYEVIEKPVPVCSVCGDPTSAPVTDANGLVACADCADGIAEEHDHRGKLNHRGMP